LPLSRVPIFRPLAASGSSSAVTTHGPSAPVPSKFFPAVHYADLRWYSRMLPSFIAV